METQVNEHAINVIGTVILFIVGLVWIIWAQVKEQAQRAAKQAKRYSVATVLVSTPEAVIEMIKDLKGWQPTEQRYIVRVDAREWDHDDTQEAKLLRKLLQMKNPGRVKVDYLKIDS